MSRSSEVDSNCLPNICLISFSEIYKDARVLREIDVMVRYYTVTVIGFGSKPSCLDGYANLKWVTLKFSSKGKLLRRITYLTKIIKELLIHMVQRKKAPLYEAIYWTNFMYAQAFTQIVDGVYDAIHANDWDTLPLAAEAARRTGAKLVFDAHEYAPLEWENRLLWKLIFPPMIRYWLRKYAASVDAFITVEQEIGARYQREYGWDPVIIRNIPDTNSVQKIDKTSQTINLIHHGGAVPDRKLEKMIQTIALCNDCFHLNFMLTGNKGYIKQLKDYSTRVAPGRVTFHQPVPTSDVVKTVSAYDLGFYLLEPNSYNNRMALPNKLFDFIAAGLGVVIGPSPAMARLIQEYNLGCVAPSFKPTDVARLLNSLDRDQIQCFQQASIKAAKTLNANVEMQKLIQLYQSLFKS